MCSSAVSVKTSCVRTTSLSTKPAARNWNPKTSNVSLKTADLYLRDIISTVYDIISQVLRAIDWDSTRVSVVRCVSVMTM